MTSPLQMDTAATMAQAHSLPSVPQNADINKLRDTAQDFEAVFLSQMLKPMFEGLETDGMFGGGQGEKMWRSLMVDEYGKSIAKSGGIGLADAVMAEMIKMQEVK